MPQTRHRRKGIIAGSLLSHEHSYLVIAKDSLGQSFVCDRPAPRATSSASEEAFGVLRAFPKTVLFEGFHLRASRVGEEMLEVLVFECECVACDTCSSCQLDLNR